MKEGGLIAVVAVLVIAILGLGVYLVMGNKAPEQPPLLGLGNQLVGGGLGIANTAVDGGLEVADDAVNGLLSPDFIPAIVEDIVNGAGDIVEDLAGAVGGAVDDISQGIADIFTGGRA